jgi:uncharacterized protein YjbI with pentapeptide repeats
MEQKRRIAPWIALGTLVGVVAAWGGFGLVGAATSAPATVTTCTNAKNGKTKVTAVCKPGKGFAKTWTDVRYAELLQNRPHWAAGQDFRGLDLSSMVVGVDLQMDSANFSGDNFTNSDWYQAASGGSSDFTGANFTNAFLRDVIQGSNNYTNANFTSAYLGGSAFPGSVFTGAIWNNTICPDGTNSNGNDGLTCVGHGLG